MGLQQLRIIAVGCSSLMIALLGVTTSAVAQEQPLTLQLAAQNNSGISGTATFTPSGTGLRVDVRVTGAGAGPEPSHIHPGSCATLDPTPQFTLASVTNGAATTDVQTTLQTLTATPHAVHIHKSVDELSVYVACADIKPAALPRTGQAETTQGGLMIGLAGLTIAGLGLVVRRLALKRT
jgi:LPXTG-motif cell wall-anchored protein